MPDFKYALTLNGVPAALKQIDNQFTVAQGIRAAASGQAAGLYVPWITGDSSPAIKAGSLSSGVIGIDAYSGSLSAVSGTSSTGTGITGQTTSGIMGGISGLVSDTTTSNIPTAITA